MSDINTPAIDTETQDRRQLAELLAGVVQGPAGETPDTDPAGETVSATDPDATSTPAAEAEAPTQDPNPAQAPEADGETPAWTNQQEAGRAFAEKNRELKALQDALAKAEAEKAYLAGLAEGRAPQKAAAPTPQVEEDPEPNPDTFTDDAAYFKAVREWDRRQAVKEAEARVEAKYAKQVESLAAQQAEAAWSASMARAEVAAGPNWGSVVAYTNHMQKVSPGFARDLNSSNDPGAFALTAWQLANGQPPSPTVQQAAKAAPPAPVPAKTSAVKADGSLDIQALLKDPATRDAVLRTIAAERANQGATPQVPTGPRGVGSGPGATGVDESLSVEAIRAMGNPKKLAEKQSEVMAAWLSAGNDTAEWPPTA